MLRITVISTLLATSSMNVLAEPIFFTETKLKSKMIFNSELRVDQTIPYGYQRGHDMHLREGNKGSGASANIDFRDYNDGHCLDDFNNVFDWSLSRSGTDVSFAVDKKILTNSSNSGEWDGLGLFFDTRGKKHLFNTAWISLTINQWNGEELANPFIFKSSLGDWNYLSLVDDKGLDISDVSGTVEYHWDMSYWNKHNQSPKNKLSLTWEGYEIYGWDPVVDVGGAVDGTEVGNVSTPPFNAILFVFAGVAAFLYRRKNQM